jgi:chorismate mutase
MSDMPTFRNEIDAIDEQIVALLAKRLNICREVAAYKNRTGMPMMQPERIRQIMQRFHKLGKRHDVDPAFLERLYRVVIEESCRLEGQLMANPEQKSPGSTKAEPSTFTREDSHKSKRTMRL